MRIASFLKHSAQLWDARLVVVLSGAWPLLGRVVWLTAEQGGRASGPPPINDWDYAHTAYVPPQNFDTGLASFALRGFEPGAWTSTAEGRWVLDEDGGAHGVVPGSLVVCTEGQRVVAYFHVESMADVGAARTGP